MDCLVIGGGSTGAFAAWALARKGLEVELVEQRVREEAGASWHNDVERGIFVELGLGEPPPGVVVTKPPRFVMTTPCRSVRHSLGPLPAMGVDMPSLTSWLLERAEEAGAKLQFGTKATIGRWTGSAREVLIGDETVTVPVVFDARGNDAAFGAPGAPLHDIVDLCNAHQALHEISDIAGARSFLRRNEIAPDEILSIAGVEDGFSVMHVSVSADESHVALLAASQPFPDRRPGRELVSAFAESNPWVGAHVSGGGAPIPLRPTSGTLVEDGLVRAGNAAGQVFPSTGSGVALGLRAAKMAAEAIDDALGAGKLVDKEILWPYNRRYQTGPGAVCAAYQPVRYLISSLSRDQVRRLLAAGIVSSESIAAAYRNSRFPAGPAVAARAVRSLPELATLLPRLVSALALSAALDGHYRLFPRNPEGYAAWAVRMEWLMGAASRVALRRLPS